MTALDDLPVRYSLPVTSVQSGMCTADGRPVLHVSQPYTSDGDRLWVTVQVGERRQPDLGNADTDRRPETWHVQADIPITLGVFDNTDVDGSGRRDATPLPTLDGRTIVIRRDGVRLALSYIGRAALGQSMWLWRAFNHTRSFASYLTWATTLDQARAHALTAATAKAPSQRAARAPGGDRRSPAAAPTRPARTRRGVPVAEPMVDTAAALVHRGPWRPRGPLGAGGQRPGHGTPGAAVSPGERAAR